MLEQSGIISAYECITIFLNFNINRYIDAARKLCSEGLPTSNFFELCSEYILEYETIHNEKSNI